MLSTFSRFVFVAQFVFAALSLASHPVYDEIQAELQSFPGVLSECHCQPGLTRESSQMSSSLRGEIDRQAAIFLTPFAHKTPLTNILFLASGSLLNEATITGHIMQAGVSPRIFLVDKAYAPDVQHSDFSTKTFEQLLASIEHFKKLVSTFETKFGVSAEVKVFYSLSEALDHVKALNENLAAFFMLDFFFPTDHALKWTYKEFNSWLTKTSTFDWNHDLLLFILNRKEPGPLSNEKINAELNILSAGVSKGSIESWQTLYSKTE